MENKTKAWAGLDRVTENAIAQIKAIAPLHTIEFVPISHSRLEFYVFYKTNEDLKTSTNDKTSESAEQIIEQELEKIGRGTKNGVEVRFEFDSHENVLEKFDGSYQMRLR